MQDQEYLGTATYSPEDNKLRFYPFARLSKTDYDRAKAEGFKWAPAQELFVAPMWTPDREDLLLEWCGEVGDEDKTLVERQEERAERFENYSEKRQRDADQAQKAVAAIADNIPLGQPILVGHHSERHARRDAERIENGMRRAVKMWETSKYWEDRAAGAISHAKYKELPGVRMRRIKNIEADKRKMERNRAEAERALRFWRGEFNIRNKTTNKVRKLEITEANRETICRVLGSDSGLGYLPVIKQEGSGLKDWWHAWDVLRPDEERYSICPRGTVEQCREAAEKVYGRQLERIARWIAHYDNRLTFERAMLAADGGTASDKVAPEVGGAVQSFWAPRGGWAYIQKVNKVTVTILHTWHGERISQQKEPLDKLCGVMSKAQVEQARAEGRLQEREDKIGFYLSGETTPEPTKTPEKPTELNAFEQMAQTLKAGVQVVSAPQLFPTPADLAQRVVELAEITAGDKVLEPSAGTGNLVRSIIEHGAFASDVVAVEINGALAGKLSSQFPGVSVKHSDFLTLNGELGKFDRIVMNPPFERGADIQHILHAKHMLNDGGRLVAICAGGPRQREALACLGEWIDLPAGSFKASGTNVNAAIVVIEN